jgi:thiol-disulfide isomerase/thioredoxin
MPHRLALCALLATALGCGQASQSPVDSQAAAEPAPSAAPAEAVTLQILDYDGLQALLKSHRGKYVVMDAWSTSCPPCVREFPNLVKLHEKYGDKVACVSLSFDYQGLDPPEVVKEPVLGFLKQQNAAFDNVLSSVEADDLYKKLDLAAVPAVFVYDREGQLRKRFDNSTGEEFTYEDVEAYLTELMADPREGEGESGGRGDS